MVIFSFNVTCKNLSVSAQTSLILKSISIKIIKAHILSIYKITENNKYDFIKFLEISFAEPISGVKLIPNYSTHWISMSWLNLFNVKIDNNQLNECDLGNISDIAYPNTLSGSIIFQNKLKPIVYIDVTSIIFR